MEINSQVHVPAILLFGKFFQWLQNRFCGSQGSLVAAGKAEKSIPVAKLWPSEYSV
jgi:hypothetical protein